jgi:leader peptidase (prepilin peptidase) / N-methyltransferase
MEISASAYALLLAPFVGSFVSVIALRSRAPVSIVWERSACRVCRHALGPSDLVPVFSWIALRGRCRYCGASIGAVYPIIEIATIGIAAWSASLLSGWWLWASCAFGWTLLALAVADIRYQLLPDFLTLPLLAGGLATSAIFVPEEFVPRLLGAGAGLGVILIARQTYWMLRRREGIGLGDAKLLAAAGAWITWEGLPSAMLVATLGALAGVLLRSHSEGRPSLNDRVPFGAYLCLGVWLVWLYGPLNVP